MKNYNFLDVILSPNITEKATYLSEFNKVVFKVRKDANKKLIKKCIEKVFKVDSRPIASNMFNLTYQLFLNEIYYFSSMELMQYTMTKRYLEDIDFILHPDKQIRFNRRQNRLYIDSDYSSMKEDDYLIIECYRVLNTNDYPKVYNDRCFKNYFTAKLKKQWGQNLIKFQGVKLPGGIELNGRAIYDDGVAEMQAIEDKMSTEFELPPLDFIG